MRSGDQVHKPLPSSHRRAAPTGNVRSGITASCGHDMPFEPEQSMSCISNLELEDRNGRIARVSKSVMRGRVPPSHESGSWKYPDGFLVLFEPAARQSHDAIARSVFVDWRFLAFFEVDTRDANPRVLQDDLYSCFSVAPVVRVRVPSRRRTQKLEDEVVNRSHSEIPNAMGRGV